MVFGNLRININSNILLFVSSGTASYKYISFTDTTSWYHLVCVFKSGDITNSKIYLDGVDQTTTDVGTFPSSLSLTGLKTIIGAYHSINQVFQGKLSNVAIFNTALTSTQVETLYNNGSPSTDISSLSPTAWYKLNAADTFDGSNWTINDYGSGGNDGTSSGMDSSNLVVSDLQQTSGYSPYALDFDGINDYLDFNNASANIMTNKNAISVSGWFKLNSNTTSTIAGNWYGSGLGQYLLRYNSGTGLGLQWYIKTNSNTYRIDTNYFPSVGDWVHIVGVKDPTTNGGQIRFYVNTVEYTQNNTDFSVAIANNNNSDQIGVFNNSTAFMDGSISNVAYWTDTALTQAQVTEIFNEGRPSNLNTFSGNAPAHWLQIGSNSSFNTNWTCLDEIGTNNAVSANMSNDDIVDGVGYSASGLGTSSIDIVGDAPYSTANGLSENMDVLDRTLDTPIRNTHSIQLDGIDDYVTMGNVLDTSSTGASAFSMSCWFKTSASGQDYFVVGKSKNSGQLDGYSQWINSAGEIRFFLGRYTGNAASSPWVYVKTTTTWNDGNWHNAVLTYNGNQNTSGLTLYVDGNPEPLTTVFNNTPSINSTDSEFMIGARGKSGDVGGFFEGKVDEVAMFNSELSAPQVASIYNNGNPNNILPLNPVSWHRFESLTTNGGVVTTADSSGNGLTGTVENGASLSTVVP